MPTLSWIKQLGSSADDRANAIAVDQQGNVFISGRTWGELASGQAKGGADAFLAKYTPAGEQEWIRQLGSSFDDGANAIAVDQRGNVFISGSTGGELVSGQAKGGADAFLAKYTPAGEQEWVRQLGSSFNDGANAIAVDQQGNVFIGGDTSGDFVSGQVKGEVDAFLAKYTPAGEQEWIRQLGRASGDYWANAITLDQRGNIFITGETSGDLASGLDNGDGDAFLAKYNANGEEEWMEQLGSAACDGANAVAVDQSGNVFISGYTRGEVASGQAKGGGDAFLAKYTDSGEQEWIKQLGSSSFDYASAVAVDQSGNVFISGYTRGELASGEAKGEGDAFLAKFTDSGEQEWIKQLGSSSFDKSRAIAVDQSGHIFISGYTLGELVSGQAKGGADAFLAKFVDD